MKHILQLVLAIIGLTNLNAQTEKGTWVIGANTNLSAYSQKTSAEFEGRAIRDGDKKQFNIKPSFGYFVADNFLISVGMYFNNEKETEVQHIPETPDYSDPNGGVFPAINVPSGEKFSQWLVGPAVTYFFGESKIKPFVNTQLSFGKSIHKDLEIAGDFETKTNITAFTLGGGAAFFINDRISLNAMVGWNKTWHQNVNEESYKMTAKGLVSEVGFALYL